MNNNLANLLITLGIVWTLVPIIFSKQVEKQAKQIMLFAGAFCLGMACAIYVL